ncbi:MAG TPA: hypothetical protein PLX15_04415 [Candidatus Woesearchaeota archaeon]|mgnify:CR=1 FL=1|nr:hypothetical protein [Candidatus Woesearchaeota archaeon]
MKAVILCSGHGIVSPNEVRLVPKALMSIDNEPMIYILMKHFYFYGVKDFILSTDSKGLEIKKRLYNDTFSDSIKRNLSKWKIDFFDSGDNVKTGARIFKIKHLVSKEDFLVSYVDTLADINISELLAFHRTKGCILTMSGVHPTSRLGVISHKDGYVTGYDTDTKSHSTIKGGFFVCKPEIFDYLSNDCNCALEEEPLQKLIKENQVALFDHLGFWKHIDYFKDLDDLKKMNHDENPSWKIQ